MKPHPYLSTQESPTREPFTEDRVVDQRSQWAKQSHGRSISEGYTLVLRDSVTCNGMYLPQLVETSNPSAGWAVIGPNGRALEGETGGVYRYRSPEEAVEDVAKLISITSPPKPFKSFAHWPDGSVSDDGHDTREQAGSFPIATWVEPKELPQVLKDLPALKAKQRAEPWGALLVRYGFDPYETESSARRVAERAAEEIGLLSQSIHNLLVHMAALGGPSDEDSLVRARAAIERINRKEGK